MPTAIVQISAPSPAVGRPSPREGDLLGKALANKLDDFFGEPVIAIYRSWRIDRFRIEFDTLFGRFPRTNVASSMLDRIQRRADRHGNLPEHLVLH